MTTNTWKIFLNQNFCGEDSKGNRACDNGVLCDKCQANWVQDAYKQWKVKQGK